MTEYTAEQVRSIINRVACGADPGLSGVEDVLYSYAALLEAREIAEPDGWKQVVARRLLSNIDEGERHERHRRNG